MTSTALVALVVTAVLTACSSDDEPSGPTDAGCDTGVLDRAEDESLAVLLGTDAQGRASLYGVDVRSGDFEVRCNLPAEWKPAQASGLTMLFQGEPFPPRRPPDVLFGTQWVSPDYHWAAGPRQPLIDVRTGTVVAERPIGDIVAVGRDTAIVTRVDGDRATWCLAPLPPVGQTCDPLPDPGPTSGYVLGVDGRPTPQSVVTQLLNLDRHTVYVLTDGVRIYRAEWYRPGTDLIPETPDGASGTPPFQVAVPAEGNAVTAYSRAGIPGLVRLFDWFTPGQRQGLLIRSDGHGSDLDDAQLRKELPVDPSTHYVLGRGDQMVIGQPDDDRTRFTMIFSGSERIVDLTDRSGVQCPTVDCRILYWPNVIPG